jgi:outer membrane protein assembly factor BamB
MRAHIAIIALSVAMGLGAAAAWLTSAATPAAAELASTVWPMFHGDLAHTGRSAVAGPTTSHIKWIYDNPARWVCQWACVVFRSSPTIGADGTIYLGVGFAPLCALDPADGSEHWCVTGSTADMSSPSISSDGSLYIGARDNHLWAVGAAGAVKWQYAIHGDGDVLTAPALAPDGTIYMASNFGGYFHAINPDGSLKWRLRMGKTSKNISPALAADGTIYFGTTDGSLQVLSPAGVRLWSLKFGGTNLSSSPVIGPDGTIYIGSAKGLSAIDPVARKVRWTFKTTGQIESTPALGADGTLYVGTTGPRPTFYAISASGQSIWSVPGIGQFRSSPVLDRAGMIYATSGPWVWALRSADGHAMWTYQTGGLIYSSPSIGPTGALYVASSDNKLYAFGP